MLVCSISILENKLFLFLPLGNKTKLYIRSSVVPISGKSQPCIGKSYKFAAVSKGEVNQIWAESLVTQDVRNVIFVFKNKKLGVFSK